MMTAIIQEKYLGMIRRIKSDWIRKPKRNGIAPTEIIAIAIKIMARLVPRLALILLHTKRTLSLFLRHNNTIMQFLYINDDLHDFIS